MLGRVGAALIFRTSKTKKGQRKLAGTTSKSTQSEANYDPLTVLLLERWIIDLCIGHFVPRSLRNLHVFTWKINWFTGFVGLAVLAIRAAPAAFVFHPAACDAKIHETFRQIYSYSCRIENVYRDYIHTAIRRRKKRSA